MKILFWMNGLSILYAYAGYPLVLMLWPGWKEEESELCRQPVVEPAISMIIPVHNEERIIREKIENTLSLDYPEAKREILVISDGSSDRTAEIVKEYGKDGVRYFELSQRQGKAGALNLGLQKVQNEIVIFSDASIILERDSLKKIIGKFINPRIGCVSGEDYIPEGGGEGAYGKYELFLRNLESRVGSIVGASGCFYAQRRSLCDPFPEGMAPDFFSVLKTVEKGFRAVTEPMAKGFMRTLPDPKSEFERKIRTFLRGMTTLLQFKSLLNPFRYGVFSVQLISHKLIRWSVGFFMVLLLLSNLFLLSSKMYFSFFWLQVVFYSLACIGWMKLSSHIFFRIPLFFSMVNLSAMVAWCKYLSGLRQEIWEPSKR